MPPVSNRLFSAARVGQCACSAVWLDLQCERLVRGPHAGTHIRAQGLWLTDVLRKLIHSLDAVIRPAHITAIMPLSALRKMSRHTEPTDWQHLRTAQQGMLRLTVAL